MGISQLVTNTIILYLMIIIWSIIALILQGFAMYRAARKKSKGWFWVLLIFSTAGILPLLYLMFSEKAK